MKPSAKVSQKEKRLQSYDTDMCMYNLPTILCPQSVLRRMICILEVEPPGIPARTLSTLLHTLSTDPLRMWNVRVLKPISHWRPRLAFLQLPLLQETKGFFFILHLDGKIIVNLTDMFIWLGGEIDCVYM